MNKVFLVRNKISEYIVNDKQVTCLVTIVNSFNNYFANVGKSLATNYVSQIDTLSYTCKIT